MSPSNFQIRKCTPDDVDKVRSLVSNIPPLDLHSAFTYWVLFYYFDHLCYLVECKKDQTIQCCGFISGIIPSGRNEICYLWQLGVHKEYRNKRLEQLLINAFVSSALCLGAKKLQFSIDPQNFASLNTAIRNAFRSGNEIKKIDTICFKDSLIEKDTFEDIYQIELTKQ